VALNGQEEPKYHTLWFKNLPAGDYVVRATLLSRKTEIATNANAAGRGCLDR